MYQCSLLITLVLFLVLFSSVRLILFMELIFWLVVLTSLLFVRFVFFQFLWTISIYLEAVAIVPQLIVLQRYREVENLTGHYVFLLGAYRALYIVNWVYRSYHETYYKHNWVVYICGIIQTCLYVDFFYYYVLRLVNPLFVWFVPVSNLDLFLIVSHYCFLFSLCFFLFMFLSYFFTANIEEVNSHYQIKENETKSQKETKNNSCLEFDTRSFFLVE